MELNTKPMTVVALMTAPRYELVWARNIIQHSLRRLGINLRVSEGVFYGQCMQRMLEELCETDIEVALTIDFDSVFTSEDVMRLFSDLATYEEIDAVAALQAKRGRSEPLLCPIESDGKIETKGEPFQVRTAHFGLTAIRLDSLRDLPKPWFWSTPDKDGGWETNKLDDDIYFWRNWERGGRTIFVDPEVRIGHVVEMVASYGADMQPRFQYTSEWREENIPSMTFEKVANDRTDKSVERVSTGEGVSLNGSGERGSEVAHCAGVCQ